MKLILIFPIWLFVVYGVEVIVINTIRNRPSWSKPAVVHTLYSIPRLNYVIGTIDGGTAVSKPKLNYKEIEINSGIVIPKSKESTILYILDSIFSPPKIDYFGGEEISGAIAVSKPTPWLKSKLNYEETEINRGIVFPKPEESTFLDILGSILSPPKVDYGREEISGAIAVSKPTPLHKLKLNYGIEEIVGVLEVSKFWPKPKCPNQQLNYGGEEISGGIIIPKPKKSTILDILDSKFSSPKINYGRGEMSGGIPISKPTPSPKPKLNYGEKTTIGKNLIPKPKKSTILDILDSKFSSPKINYGRGEMSGEIPILKPTPSPKPKLNYGEKTTIGKNLIPKPKKSTILDILDSKFSPPKINYGRGKMSGGIPVSKPTPSSKPKLNYKEKKTTSRNVIPKPKKSKFFDIFSSTFRPPKFNYEKGKISGGIPVSKPTPSPKPKLNNYEEKKTTGRNVIPKPKKSKFFDIFSSTFRPPKFNYEKGKISSGIPVSKPTPSPKPKLNYEEKKTSGRNVIPKPKKNKILDKLGSTFNPPKTEYEKGEIRGKKSVSKPTPKPKLNFGKGEKSSGIGVSKHTPLPKPKRNYGEKKTSGRNVVPKPKKIKILDKLSPSTTKYGKGEISGKKAVSKPTPKPKINFGKSETSRGIGASKHTARPKRKWRKRKLNYGKRKISGGIVTPKPNESTILDKFGNISSPKQQS